MRNRTCPVAYSRGVYGPFTNPPGQWGHPSAELGKNATVNGKVANLGHLYHACDTEAADMLFCVSSYHSLQFADFMCGIFAFWMTLLMIASLPLIIHMPLVVLGAVGIGFAVRIDVTGHPSFIVPTSTAGLIVVVSWVIIYQEFFSPREIVGYESYSDVFVIRLTVPEDATEAIWELNSYEDGNCDPSNVTVVFNPGGYVVINPDGAKFPSNFRFIPPREGRHHTLSFGANNATATLQVLHPEPGSWYLVAFKEKSAKIVQDGLGLSCDTYIYGRGVYKVERNIIHLIPQVHEYQDIKVFQELQGKQFYKFYVPANTWRVSINITFCKIKQGTVSGASTACPIVLAASPKEFPDTQRNNTMWKDCGDSDFCELEFPPVEEAWHYASVEVNMDDFLNAVSRKSALDSDEQLTVEFGIKVLLDECQEEELSPQYLMMTEMNLKSLCEVVLPDGVELKKDKVILPFPRQHSDVTNDTGLSLSTRGTNCWKSSTLHFRSHNSISSEPQLVTFDLQDLSDVGGGLFLGLWLEENFLDDFDAGISVRVSSCLSFETRGEILSHENVSSCSRGAYWQTNTTVPPPVSKEEATKRRSRYPELYLVVPFPHPGQWWLTIQAECFQAKVWARESLLGRTSCPPSIPPAPSLDGAPPGYWVRGRRDREPRSAWVTKGSAPLAGRTECSPAGLEPPLPLPRPPLPRPPPEPRCSGSSPYKWISGEEDVTSLEIATPPPPSFCAPLSLIQSI
ncbi:unnamed protein product [Cyprideis torosa]|uniref:Uncharacterized protein n=1 Tax=Cyprideis torosa TaxID=163714 RepID=A0A7R8W4E9_9CRUS|nr:unnamed protein product [Cyprideis torosa]CAG0881832.1 unnamed protein product [Cyprideis torosa]